MSSREKLVIIGIGDTACRLYDFITYHNLFDVIGFSANREYIKDTTIQGRPVFPLEELDSCIDKSEVKIFVAILWNRLNSQRRKVYQQLDLEGYQFANIISPTAILISKDIGKNCWIKDFVLVRPKAKIGNNCIVEDYAHIGNHSVVEDHCFLGVRSLVAADCCVGEQSFVGISTTLFEKVKIGRKCIVGGGSIVKRNLADFSVIKISSDAHIIKKYAEEDIEDKLDATKSVR